MALSPYEVPKILRQKTAMFQSTIDQPFASTALMHLDRGLKTDSWRIRVRHLFFIGVICDSVQHTASCSDREIITKIQGVGLTQPSFLDFQGSDGMASCENSGSRHLHQDSLRDASDHRGDDCQGPTHATQHAYRLLLDRPH